MYFCVSCSIGVKWNNDNTNNNIQRHWITTVSYFCPQFGSTRDSQLPSHSVHGRHRYNVASVAGGITSNDGDCHQVCDVLQTGEPGFIGRTQLNTYVVDQPTLNARPVRRTLLPDPIDDTLRTASPVSLLSRHSDVIVGGSSNNSLRRSRSVSRHSSEASSRRRHSVARHDSQAPVFPEDLLEKFQKNADHSELKPSKSGNNGRRSNESRTQRNKTYFADVHGRFSSYANYDSGNSSMEGNERDMRHRTAFNSERRKRRRESSRAPSTDDLSAPNKCIRRDDVRHRDRNLSDGRHSRTVSGRRYVDGSKTNAGRTNNTALKVHRDTKSTNQPAAVSNRKRSVRTASKTPSRHRSNSASPRPHRQGTQGVSGVPRSTSHVRCSPGRKHMPAVNVVNCPSDVAFCPPVVVPPVGDQSPPGSGPSLLSSSPLAASMELRMKLYTTFVKNMQRNQELASKQAANWRPTDQSNDCSVKYSYGTSRQRYREYL